MPPCNHAAIGRALCCLLLILPAWGCVPGQRPVDNDAPYRITGSGGRTTGPLAIQRITLEFANGLGDRVVPRGGQLRPRAILRFAGNGLFRAAWKADGQIVEEIAFQVTFGNTITLRPRRQTIFPTILPGPHRLTLEVREPSGGISTPVLRYVVSTEEAAGS